jgi:hypothetical protein
MPVTAKACVVHQPVDLPPLARRLPEAFDLRQIAEVGGQDDDRARAAPQFLRQRIELVLRARSG